MLQEVRWISRPAKISNQQLSRLDISWLTVKNFTVELWCLAFQWCLEYKPAGKQLLLPFAGSFLSRKRLSPFHAYKGKGGCSVSFFVFTSLQKPSNFGKILLGIGLIGPRAFGSVLLISINNHTAQKILFLVLRRALNDFSIKLESLITRRRWIQSEEESHKFFFSFFILPFFFSLTKRNGGKRELAMKRAECLISGPSRAKEEK